MNLYETTVKNIKKPDCIIMEETQKRLDYLLKPKGSLGKLEDIAKKLSGITGSISNPISKKAIMVMCSDNGVYEEGIASSPKELSTIVAETMVTGLSGVAVLAKHAGAALRVVDVGLDIDSSRHEIVNRKVRRGTDNFRKGPAMSREEAIKAIEVGIDETNKMIDNGYNLIGTGEVGMGNTTTSSAVVYAFTGCDIDTVVGRGAGLTDEAYTNKKMVVKEGVELNKPDINDPLDVLAKVGGFDIAALVGVFLSCASRRVPVVIDGFISGAAALVAYKINPLIINYTFASHGTQEPGGRIISRELGLEPPLYMDMRLGEGTGCALAFNLFDASSAMMNNMGTFGDIKL